MNIHQCLHRSPPLIPITSHLNPISILIRFIIIQKLVELRFYYMSKPNNASVIKTYKQRHFWTTEVHYANSEGLCRNIHVMTNWLLYLGQTVVFLKGKLPIICMYCHIKAIHLSSQSDVKSKRESGPRKRVPVWIKRQNGSLKVSWEVTHKEVACQDEREIYMG